MRDFFVMAHMDEGEYGDPPDTVCGFVQCEDHIQAIEKLQALIESEWRRRWPKIFNDSNPVYTEGWGILQCSRVIPASLAGVKIWVCPPNNDDILHEIIVEV
jgi:hypothetical protein